MLSRPRCVRASPEIKLEFWLTNNSVLRFCAMQRRLGTRPVARPRKVDRTSSTSNTAKNSGSTSKPFIRRFAKYNPEGNQVLNQRQSARLKRLSDYLHGKSQSRLMFELLVPAEKAQLDELRGGK